MGKILTRIGKKGWGILLILMVLFWVTVFIQYWNFYSPFLDDIVAMRKSANVSSISILNRAGSEINQVWLRFSQIVFFAFISIAATLYLMTKTEK